MNFKKLMAGVLGTGLVMSLGVNSMTAYANEVSVVETGGAEATVSFEGQGLSLTSIQPFDFGEQDITATTENYVFTLSSYELQVTDLRGTGKGWGVTAEASDFTSEGEETLEGYELIFSNGEAYYPDEFVEGQEPQTHEVTLESGEDSAVEVATAIQGETYLKSQGVGQWTMRWLAGSEDSAGVRLEVPERSASEGDHTATITWTLTSDMTTGPDSQGSDVQ